MGWGGGVLQCKIWTHRERTQSFKILQLWMILVKRNKLTYLVSRAISLSSRLTSPASSPAICTWHLYKIYRIMKDVYKKPNVGRRYKSICWFLNLILKRKKATLNSMLSWTEYRSIGPMLYKNQATSIIEFVLEQVVRFFFVKRQWYWVDSLKKNFFYTQPP